MSPRQATLFPYTTLFRSAEKISRIAGRKINYVDMAPAEFKKAILSGGMPEWSADALVDLQRLYREGKASLLTDEDRKSTRLNSSHLGISYAVFCLKKKKN